MERIYLVGAEEVRSAASIMSSAADSMRQTSYNIQGAVDQMERVLQSFSQDMAALIERMEAFKP